jgi:radical SAM-linked protein
VARTPEGPPPPPAVQRLRLRYAKRGRLRFASHRDFQRAFERALRRAEIPMAYSAGFSPHPKVSYAGAAPTGTASEAEYLEIALVERREPGFVQASLDSSLPLGLDVLEVVEARSGSLADRLTGSVWRLLLPGAEPGVAAAAVAAYLAQDRVEVERLTKSGGRRFDTRGAIRRLQVVTSPSAANEGDVTPCAILQLVVRHSTPAVRPDDVLAGLRLVADLAPPSPPLVTRLAQGLLDEGSGQVADPLVADREAPLPLGTEASGPTADEHVAGASTQP